jgi:hypothetical protein
MRDSWKNNLVSGRDAALHKATEQCPCAEPAKAMARRLNDVRRRTDYILLTRLCFYGATLRSALVLAAENRVKLMRCTNLTRNALQSHFFA